MSNTPRPPRLNALKHGIMSRETLITSGDCAEDEAEFSQQSTALYDQYEPEGAIEQLLVEQLIAFTWRWRRILRYENAAVRSQCRDSVEEARRPQPVYDSSGFYPVPVPGQSRDLDAELRDLDADLAALDTPDPLSARPALAGLVLESAEPEFDVSVKRVLHLRTPWREHRGYSKAQIEQVVSTCRGDDLTVGEYWAALRARITLRRAAVADEVAHRERNVASAIDLAVIPSEPRRFSVQRYEAHISRQFYRALHELTRIQAARVAAPPPPCPPPSPLEGEGPGMRGEPPLREEVLDMTDEPPPAPETPLDAAFPSRPAPSPDLRIGNRRRTNPLAAGTGTRAKYLAGGANTAERSPRLEYDAGINAAARNGVVRFGGGSWARFLGLA